MPVLMLASFVTSSPILQPAKKPSKQKDLRDDRAGSLMHSTGDSREYEGNLQALEEESRKEKPASKEVRQLMKATFHGLFVFSLTTNTDEEIEYDGLYVLLSCTMYRRPEAVDPCRISLCM